jgi:hypothetical protein
VWEGSAQTLLVPLRVPVEVDFMEVGLHALITTSVWAKMAEITAALTPLAQIHPDLSAAHATRVSLETESPAQVGFLLLLFFFLLSSYSFFLFFLFHLNPL